MKPKRVQLSRAKGWRLPDNTVNVARPGKWGNPFPVGKRGPLGREAVDREGAVGFFRDMLSDPEMMAETGYPVDITPLRGKNLACWCPFDGQPCHADILLEIANSGEEQ